MIVWCRVKRGRDKNESERERERERERDIKNRERSWLCHLHSPHHDNDEQQAEMNEDHHETEYFLNAIYYFCSASTHYLFIGN